MLKGILLTTSKVIEVQTRNYRLLKSFPFCELPLNEMFINLYVLYYIKSKTFNHFYGNPLVSQICSGKTFNEVYVVHIAIQITR